MLCKHCGRRIERSHYALPYSPKYVHVTANGDRLGSYCELVLAEPAETEGD